MEKSSVAGACYPFTVLPGLSRLFQDYIAGEAREFFAVPPVGNHWMTYAAPPAMPNPALADLLEAQNHACHAGPAAIANIAKLRIGARAVVTGQQVGLFGGPLYTLYKAATAIRLARDASEATGVPHVPIFWLATEDHDFAEIAHVALPGSGGSLETVRLGGRPEDHSGNHSESDSEAHPDSNSSAPVGALRLQAAVESALAQAGALLGGGPEWELLRRCYRPEATFAGAFAQWLASTFREQGLIVFDAAGRIAHGMGRKVLRQAITDAVDLEQLVMERGKLLEQRGYHQQVLVKPGSSLLFLLGSGASFPSEADFGRAGNRPHARLPLKRRADGSWTAGHAVHSTAALLAILDDEPERLSPNALLRPVFQDAILPTAAYIGGPAEIAYFAQNAVLQQHMLGRQTPVLPRLSATLLSAKDAATMEHDGIDLPDIFRLSKEELIQRIGARNIAMEGKQRLHAAGSAMTDELEALTAWMRGMDENLGRSADVAASKMRYQMNRLRRLAARWELEKDASIRRRVAALYAALYPDGHLQERSVGAVAALARHGAALPTALVEAAGDPCPGHKTLQL